MPKPKTFEEMMEESSKALLKYETFKKRVQTTQILVESLEENGASSTLHLLVSLASTETDDKIEDMLLMFPTMVCLHKFLKKIPSYEVDEKTFEYLMKQGVHFV